MYQFEYHPQVESYQEQPSVEYYYDEAGVQRKYYPDFQVNFKDGRVLLVEVKPTRYLNTKKVRNQLRAVAARFAEQDRPFRVLTEQEIRREPLFSNLKQLHKSCRQMEKLESPPPQFAKLTRGPSWLLEKLVGFMGSKDMVLQLIRFNHLHADLERPFSNDTVVSLPITQEGQQNASFRI